MEGAEYAEKYTNPVDNFTTEAPPQAPYNQPPQNRSRSPYRGRDRNRSRSRSPRRRSRSPQFRGRRRSNERDDRSRGPGGRPDTEPIESYKAFMMRQEDNVAPEVCLQRYEDYKKRVMVKLSRAFFDIHKMEEWLQERYSPAIRHRLLQQNNHRKISEAKSFAARVKTMQVSFDEAAWPSDSTQLPDFFNDLEESARLLYIRRIPCSCPFSVLSEAISRHGAFQDLLLSDPLKKRDMDFERSAYILYETAAAAAEAMPKLQNLLVEAPEIPHPLRLQVMIYRMRAPLKTPSYMSLPDRVQYDLKQALQLAKTLDSNALKNDFIGSILADLDEEKSDRHRLDIIISYLRRVHHFIYYAGVQCIDLGDVMHAYPALFVRPAATERDIEDDKTVTHKVFGDDGAISPGAGWGAWAVALDERIETALKTNEPSVVESKRREETVLVQDIETREEQALEPVYNSYTEKAGDDGKHRCLLCTKLFKSLEFVKKHIRNKHPELVVEKIFVAGESFMWDQYRDDPDRPMDPIITSHQPVARSSYDRRDNYNGRGNGGGYYRQQHFDGGRGGGYRGGGRGGYGGPSQNYPRRYENPPRQPQMPRSDRPLPVDPRQISTSYQDLDSIPTKSIELDFQDALGSLPPPKKQKKDE